MGILHSVSEKVSSVFAINRTVSRTLEDFVKRQRRVRVVVLGSKNSGKTIFLTSLACHLQHHSMSNTGIHEFDIGGWEASLNEDYRPPKRQEGEPQSFPYDEYRNGFAKPQPEWPKKTSEEMSILRLPLVFRKQGHQERTVLIELMDLPGERVADLPMAHRNYREWCEWMNRKFAGEYNSVEAYRSYLEKIKTVSKPEELYAAYKEFLVVEYKKFSPWVTPSIVKLTKTSSTGFLEEIDNRPLGVDSDSQFVPLPQEAFAAGHALNSHIKTFEESYRKYRHEIVDPIADWLAEADQLVYLVDVLGILKAGVAAYNAEQTFGSAVIKMFEHRRTRAPLGGIVDYLSGLVRTKIKDAYLVATKADIARGEKGREAMCNLAEQLLGKPMRCLGLDGSGRNVRACAAVNTIRPPSGDKGDVTARQQANSAEESAYNQLDVPEQWPDSLKWQAEIDAARYWFEDTFPLFDAKGNSVPGHIGLDDLAKSFLANVL